MKHTPGPWKIGVFNTHTVIRTEKGLGHICALTEAPRSQQIADARLIAAAPELLNACYLALEELPEGYIAQTIRTAIDKAEGM